MKLHSAFKATDFVGLGSIDPYGHNRKPGGLAFAGHRIVLTPSLFSSQGISRASDWGWNWQLHVAVCDMFLHSQSINYHLSNQAHSELHPRHAPGTQVQPDAARQVVEEQVCHHSKMWCGQLFLTSFATLASIPCWHPPSKCTKRTEQGLLIRWLMCWRWALCPGIFSMILVPYQ